jgi:plasmid stabilization system protein ParE
MARIDFVTGNAQIYLPEVESLAVVPDQLEAAVRGMPGGATPSGRTVQRILGDLIAYAEHDQVALHRMSWMSDPIIAPIDYDGIAESEQWATKRSEEQVDRFTAAIAATVELLKDQPDAAWGRPGLFPERRSLRQQVRRSAAHYASEIGALAGG